MEGGADEELDYDFKEEFQDDEENNTFYQDREEEEEAKLQEVSQEMIVHSVAQLTSFLQEQLKKEFRMANANVGDRPQIESDGSDDDDMEADRLNAEGKRLRRMMKKRGAVVDESGDSDSVSCIPCLLYWRF